MPNPSTSPAAPGPAPQRSPLDLSLAAAARPLAAVVRGPLVESVHLGHLVVVGNDGAVIASVGDPHAVVWPRSSLKPLQAVAMVQAGLDLADAPELLALTTASHSGQTRHLDGVRAILARAGLTEDALQNTPDAPYAEAERAAWTAAGRAPSSLAQNCSGKHAGMLLTSVTSGYDTASYLDLSHPVQRQVRAVVADLTGVRGSRTTVDGCGAPLLSTPLSGLARAFGRIAVAGADAAAGGLATGTAEAQVAAAVRAAPLMVGGDGRDVSELIAGVPGLVAKDGAEGVYAAGLPDGRGVALKVLDGSGRARPVVLAAVLAALLDASGDLTDEVGAVLDRVGRLDVLGHGRPVGRVVATLPDGLGATAGGAA